MNPPRPVSKWRSGGPARRDGWSNEQQEGRRNMWRSRQSAKHRAARGASIAPAPGVMPGVMLGAVSGVMPSVMSGMMLVAVLVAALCGAFAPLAAAQDAGKVELGGDYNYVRTNAPPGGCGCINLNGGDGWLSYNVTPSLAVVGQIGAQHASNIGGTGGADLTFTSYLFGPRFSRTVGDRFVPFAQMLLGGAHASGSLAPQNSGVGGSANAFALTAGGGLDIGLTRHLAIRAVEADYFLTRFDNGVNQRQNNFKLSAGVVVRF